ncbi:unnamed protein product [Amoebophrya sp. A120]|nr:unnamed protein product [Amoebophrya sp. A120]|eukprot:GSA120T00009902001.1
MPFLSEVSLVNGAPHVGKDPYTLGASPPGCAQSEHDVYPPAIGEWYEELVNQSGGALQRALISSTYAKTLASSATALGNQALKQLNQFESLTPELQHQNNGYMRYDTGARDIYGLTLKSGGHNAHGKGSRNVYHKAGNEYADLYKEEKDIPFTGATYIPKKPSTYGTLNPNIKTYEELGSEPHDEPPKADGVATEEFSRSSVDNRTPEERNEEFEKTGEPQSVRKFETVVDNGDKENSGDDGGALEKAETDKMHKRDERNVYVDTSATQAYLDPTRTSKPELKYGFNLLQMLGVAT